MGGLWGGAKEARKEKRSGIQDEAMEGKPKIDRRVSSHVLLGCRQSSVVTRSLSR